MENLIRKISKNSYKLMIIGILTPTFYKLTDEELEEYFVEVAKSVPADFPVYIYAIPDCAVNDVTPELVAGIAEKCENP